MSKVNEHQPDVDDAVLYIQYLQKQMMLQGWEEYFREDHLEPNKAVVDAVLKAVAPSIGETDERVFDLAREMWAAPVELRTDYDTRTTEIRYRPILDEIIEAAGELGIPAVRPIDLATSTDISCTPVARPTVDRHLLFAGEGTARFCNYWTKAISRIFHTTSSLQTGMNQADWDSALLTAKPSGIVLAALCATKYAFHGTMLRFYRVPNLPEETDWRAALLYAMLLFSIAHEYAHFVFHESYPDAEGMLSAEESQRLELECDSLAIKISVHIGTKKNRIQIRTGMGALAFYRVMQLCRGVKDLYTSAGRIRPGVISVDENTHPALEQRSAAIVAELLRLTAENDQDLVRGHINGFIGMLDTMNRLTLAMIHEAISLRQT